MTDTVITVAGQEVCEVQIESEEWIVIYVDNKEPIHEPTSGKQIE